MEWGESSVLAKVEPGSTCLVDSSLKHRTSTTMQHLKRRDRIRKETEDVAQMVECLLRMAKALGSVPCTR